MNQLSHAAVLRIVHAPADRFAGGVQRVLLEPLFLCRGKGKEARFVYENEIQKWLDVIRRSYLETTVDTLKQGTKKPSLLYADARLLNVLRHTLVPAERSGLP